MDKQALRRAVMAQVAYEYGMPPRGERGCEANKVRKKLGARVAAEVRRRMRLGIVGHR